jgi:hypothetical protein
MRAMFSSIFFNCMITPTLQLALVAVELERKDKELNYYILYIYVPSL